jgi:hypothetical protein
MKRCGASDGVGSSVKGCLTSYKLAHSWLEDPEQQSASCGPCGLTRAGESRRYTPCTMSSMQRISLHRAALAWMPRRRELAALFLAGTVLLCQGLFCTLHHFSDVELPVAPHYSSVEKGDDGGNHSGGLLEMLECGAAVLVVFAGAVILLLHKGARTWSRFAVSLLSDKYFPLSIFHLPRGPTAASRLQVFRL